MDFTFYVVAVTRLQEVAWQLHKRLEVPGMKEAAQALNDRWPRLRELRNSEEHMKGMPSGEYPFGLWYFGDQAADLRPGGRVEYVLDVESAEHDVDKLHGSIIEAIDEALRQMDQAES